MILALSAYALLMTPYEELSSISEKLKVLSASAELEKAEPALIKLDEIADKADRAFCGSWLGYHSRVYYANLEAAPPGAHFSQEWGLERTIGSLGSRGDWREFDSEEVKEFIRNAAKNPNFKSISRAAAQTKDSFLTLKSEIISVLSTEIEHKPDPFLEKLKNEIDELAPLSQREIERLYSPKGQIMTRDSTAAGQGVQVPPHIEIKAEIAALRVVFKVCKSAAEICTKAASHIERKARRAQRDARVGTNVFIGHGRSGTWRELRDFVAGRLKLPWDEFNRVPVAGVTNIARLSEMLDASAMALIILTAEDELADGELQARMNVIHEVGLFQGRLGFTKAIVLFEEGCKEFTNIQGLGQIRFPKGRISAAFEEIRAVLEREGLLG